jgi:NADPH-dependent glutamate synthase beta subunit-like oxidoreductase
MSNEENMNIENSSEPSPEEKKRQRLEMIKQAECQIRLAQDYYLRLHPEVSDIGTITMNTILEEWSDSDYSEAFRALLNELGMELKDGEKIDYDHITLEQVDVELEKLIKTNSLKRNK